MDPITMASQRFADSVCTFLRRPRARTLRIVASHEERRSAVNTLRLIERAPDNRRTFFLYEEHFTSEERYFAGLAAKLAADCAQLGLVKLRTPREGGAMHRAAVVVARIAEAKREGVLVALLPPHVEDGFAAAMRTWTGLPLPLGVKHAVLGGDVFDVEARFEVDQRLLAGFLASSALEAANARAKVVQAALVANGGDVAAARAELRAALDACRARGLAGEAEAVMFALAGADLAAGDRDAARRGFVGAAQLRGNGDAWQAVAKLAAVDGLDDVARVAEEKVTPQT
ncbi:hypothetical protein [Polyangium mundeleinium]|uniref:Tetratricopeptide repeat protein n=1 Tax=Polyangium mundeleinium TaxID=2995306 RepID=A0ABT5EGB4_9BACT|nr:hypothetical protein [Polyangium mundeleinium]MDC0740848.1 hypothetical protein [Polyangium mundeleinium]